jgi:hypothetical protein
MNKSGNGLSSSPSNTPPPFDRARYPHFTMTDNVRVQQLLLQDVFGIERVKPSFKKRSHPQREIDLHPLLRGPVEIPINRCHEPHRTRLL